MDNRVEFELAVKDAVTKELNRVKKDLDDLAKRSKESFDKVRGSTVNTTQSMINMGRVLSDLPYGFSAIANNIDPLVMSLGMGAGLGFAITGVVTSMQLLIRSSPEVVNAIFNIDAAAEKASKQGLSNFEEKLKALIGDKNTSPEQLLEIFTRIDKQIMANKKTLDSYYETIWKDTPRGTLAVRQLKQGREDEAAAIKLANERLADYKERFKEVVREAMAMKEVEKLFGQIGIVTKKSASEVDEMNGQLLQMSKTVEKIKVQQIFIPKEVREFAVEINATLTASEVRALRMIGTLESGFSALSRTVGDEMYFAFERSFKGANSLFEIFMANVAASIAELAAKEAAKTIVKSVANLIVPGSGDLINAVFGSFHNGGTVPKAHNGAYVNAPSGKEFPIMVRGGETIRTEGQERDLNNGRAGKSISVTVNVNGSGLVPRDVQQAVITGMRQSGLTVDKYFVNQRSRVVLA
jgi:hypothetical protein